MKTDSDYIQSMIEYTPSVNPWVRKAPMPQTKESFGYTVYNNKIYVAGGKSGSTYYDTLHVYDQTTDTWETKASLPSARAGLTLVTIEDVIYAVGGYTSSYPGKILISKYTPATNTWTEINVPAPPNVVLYESAVCAYNGKIYIFSGLP